MSEEIISEPRTVYFASYRTLAAVKASLFEWGHPYYSLVMANGKAALCSLVASFV